MKKRNYFNTTGLFGKSIEQAISNAKSQEEKIMIFFKNSKLKKYSPSQLDKELFNGSIPITSIRRALTNLTNNDKLDKTNEMVIGYYGKPEHIWIII